MRVQRLGWLAATVLLGGLVAPVDAAQAEIDGARLGFDEPVLTEVGLTPRGLATGDFDGDGDLDLVTLEKEVVVLEGDGAGSFAVAQRIRLAKTAKDVVAGDLDADGDLDLVVSSWDSKAVLTLRGLAGSTFDSPVEYASTARPFMSTLADLDGDGDLDVVTARWEGSDRLLLLENDGTGALTTAGTTGPPVSGHVEAADLDGNGTIDLVAEHRPGPVQVLPGNGDLTYGPRQKVDMGDAGDLVVTDLDGDATPDILVTNNAAGMVAVRLGRGDGRFGKLVQYPVGVPVSTIAVADLDLDGHADVVATHATGVSVLRGTARGKLRLVSPFPAGQRVYDPTVADFDADGWPDVAVVDQDADGIVLLRNTTGEAP